MSTKCNGHTQKGDPCLNSSSTKPNHNKLFCWRHQNQKNKTPSPKPKILSDSAFELLNNICRDKLLNKFYEENLIHSTNDIDTAINTLPKWTSKQRLLYSQICNDFFVRYKIKRQSPEGYYLTSIILDRSTYFN